MKERELNNPDPFTLGSNLPTHLSEQVEKEALRYLDTSILSGDLYKPERKCFKAGAEYLYSLLPKGMRFVDAAKELPTERDLYCCRVTLRKDGCTSIHYEAFEYRPVYGKFQDIENLIKLEWLDETEGEGERGKLAIEFSKWLQCYGWRNTLDDEWVNYHDEYETSSNLYQLFLKSISSNITR